MNQLICKAYILHVHLLRGSGNGKEGVGERERTNLRVQVVKIPGILIVYSKHSIY